MKNNSNILIILNEEHGINPIASIKEEKLLTNIMDLKRCSVDFINGYSTNPITKISYDNILNGKYFSQFSASSIKDQSFIDFIRVNSNYCVEEINKISCSDSNVDNENINNIIGEKCLYKLKNQASKNSPWIFVVSFSKQIELKDTTLYQSTNKYMKYNQQLGNSKNDYLSNMKIIDTKIGQIVKKLKEINQFDNTTIVYTSVHGYEIEKSEDPCADNLSESHMKVPLILKPSIKDYKGHKEERVGYNFDIAATCFDLLKFDIPLGMSSKSLLPCIVEDPTYAKKKDCDKDLVYYEGRNSRVIIRDGWKLIFYSNSEYGELYDLTDDIYESDNVYVKESLSKIKIGLVELLCNKMINLGDCNKK